MKRKVLAMVLAAAMVLSMSACGASGGSSGTASGGTASGGASSGEASSADASGAASESGGAGGPGGGRGGMAAEPVDLSGMLSLAKYTEESSDTDVSFGYYGMFEKNPDASGDSKAEFILGDKDPDTITVYEDKGMTKEMDGVTAKIDGDKLEISGLSGTENTVLYLGTGKGSYPTAVYIVANQAVDSDTQSLRDSTSVGLTEYAPKNGTSAVFIGGNQGLFEAGDFEDLDDLTDEDRGLANWWLQSGITNSGATMHEFGDTFYRFELYVSLYREFQIVVDINTTEDGFTDPTDCSGIMFRNDQYSDAVSADIYAGVLDGIYTQAGNDGKLENIDGVTEVGAADPVDEESIMVMVYNALVSPYASLNEDGVAVAQQLKASGAETAQEKEEALKSCIDLSDYGTYSTDKLNALSVLRDVEPYVEQKQSPDADFQAVVNSDPSSDIGQVIEDTAAETASGDADITDTSLKTDKPTSLYATSGIVKLKNSLLSSTGDNTDAKKELGIASGMPATSSLGYNMTLANAFYRDGIGAVMPAWGHDTLVLLSTTDGELMVDAADGSGSMAGGLYNGFGAAIHVDGGVVFSQGQHMSNTVYNGTIHYTGTAVLNPNGRQFSSDFWGGYVVFEDAVADGGFVSDEPTTVINKNSMLAYPNGGQINGYASMYYENSYIDGVDYTFENNTSLITDTGSLTLVNSVLNGDTIGTVTRSEKAVITLVDSTLNLNTGTILSINDKSGEPVSMDDSTFHDMFAGEAAIRIYGDVTINVPEKATFSVDSADGDEQITLYASEVDGELDDSNINVILDDSYGVLHINQK